MTCESLNAISLLRNDDFFFLIISNHWYVQLDSLSSTLAYFSPAICASGCHTVGGYCNSPGQCL